MRTYDDEIWRQVPEDAGTPPPRLVRFVRELEEARRALDLGCGDGRLTAEIRADEVVAADVSRVALERAARRLPGVTTALLEPDAPLPFEDSQFDLVVCVETLEHVRDVQLLLSEARRVLEPGGRLGLTTPAHGRLTGLAVLVGGMERRFDPLSPHLRFFSRGSLRRLLREAGFDGIGLSRSGETLLATASR